MTVDKFTIWTEKFRPKTFDDIKGQKEIVKRVRAFVEKKNMPHLLFAGPAGIGKTTLSLVVARELFGDAWKDSCLELNASDERGIDVVRNKVKDFARTKSISNVPFKIIYLDECDALTKEAQQALRRTMENYTQTTRFILSCNYSSKILDPIQSRCTVFRFKPLLKDEIKEIILKIASDENIKLDDSAVDALYDVSKGDVRRLENIMQSCAAVTSDFTAKVVYGAASFATPKEIEGVISSCVKGDFKKAKSDLLKVMLEYGLAGLDVIKQIQSGVWDTNLPFDSLESDRIKLEMSKTCGEIEFRLIEGSDEFIQLESLLAAFCLLTQKK